MQPDFATLQPVGTIGSSTAPVASSQPDFSTLKPVGSTQQATPAAPQSPASALPINPTVNYDPSKGNPLFDAVASSEVGLGQDVAAAAASVLPKSMTGVGDVQKSTTETANDAANLAHLIHAQKAQGQDTTRLETQLSSELETLKSMPGVDDLYPSLKKTNLQVGGDIAGTALDALTFGEYGAAARGAAETGKLLTAADRAAEAAKAGVTAAKPVLGLGAKLSDIGIDTAKKAGVGAAIGYGSDVSQNMKSGATGSDVFKPGLGTFTGVALPTVIGGVRAGLAIGSQEAPRIINSLVKPKNANFAYGKNPGRAVSELGITGNSLPDFENNITAAKNQIGQQIGAVYKNPANASAMVDVSDDVGKLDDAIATAAKGGKNNQGIVTQLQNVKDALLYEHGIDEDGNITKVGTEPRNLNMTAPEAQSFIQEVSGLTRFTDAPSDDKAVNGALKDVYGGVRDKINAAISPNTPEIVKLNERYGDLTSAELAVKNRNIIAQRSNVLGLTAKSAGLIAGFATHIMGGGDIKSILIGAGAAGLEKALGSTAVKSRVAAWLGRQTPGVISDIIDRNPEIGPLLQKIIPNIAGKMGKQ